MRNVVHAKDVAESSFALDFSSASYCNPTLYIAGHLFNTYYLFHSRHYLEADISTDKRRVHPIGWPTLVTPENSSPRRDFHNPIHPPLETTSVPQCRPTEIDWRDSLLHLLGWYLPIQHPPVGQSLSNLRTKGCYRLHVLLGGRTLILIE